MALVEAERYFNSFEAGMAQARLDAEGIQSFIFGIGINTAFAGGVFNVQLMVDENDLEAALQILAR